MTANVIDQVTGNNRDTSGFSNVTQEYKLQHKELDTSLRLAEFEESIKSILETQLQKENEKAVKQGKAVSDVVQFNNFENDHQTKFYQDQLKDMIGNVNNMNVEELKVQKKRMEHLSKSLEDSDAKEKDFLLEQMEESQKFIKAELEQKDSMRTKMGDKFEEALDNYAQIEGLALGLVDNNPLAGVAIKMAVAWYQRNRERKKQIKKAVENDEHKKQMAEYKNDQELKDHDQKVKNDDALRKLQETELAKESRFSRRLNEENQKENEQSETNQSESEYQNWKDGNNTESNFERDNNSNPNELSNSVKKQEPDEENRADEKRADNNNKKIEKNKRKFYKQTEKSDKKTNKLLKCICGKTTLIEKHTLKLSKMKQNGGGKGMMGMMGGIGKLGKLLGGALGVAAPALAVAGAGAFGYMIGEGINTLVEETTGDSVGGNIYNIINGVEDPKNLSKKQKKENKSLGVGDDDFNVNSNFMDDLDDKGIIDYDWVGDSKVENWKALEAEPIHILKWLYTHNDLNEEDTKHLKEILLKKQNESKEKYKIGKAKRDKEKSTKNAESDRNNIGALTGSEDEKEIISAMLTKIGKAESNGDYNAEYGGGKFGKREQDFQKMTIGEVKAYQKEMLNTQKAQGKGAGQRSSAVGKYQFISNSLKEAVEMAGLSDDDMFNAENQDKMGEMWLRKQGGLDNYLKSDKNNNDANKMQNKVAGQWASMKNTGGKGTYDGDGMNTARHSLRGEIDALANVDDKSNKMKRQLYADPVQEQMAKSADEYYSKDIASADIVPNKPPSTELTSKINSAKTDIDKSNQQKAQQPIVVANNTTNNSSGGGGGGGTIGNPMPSSARNNESSNQRITDRVISMGMV